MESAVTVTVTVNSPKKANVIGCESLTTVPESPSLSPANFLNVVTQDKSVQDSDDRIIINMNTIEGEHEDIKMKDE